MRIEETIQNKSWSMTYIDHKTVIETYPDQKNSQLGPQKSKTTPKLSQNQKSELEEL